MNIYSFKKVVLFSFGLMLCLLFVVSVSGAEQLNNDLTKQLFPVEGLKVLKGSLQEKGDASVTEAVKAERQMASSYDVKVPLNERFNAIFSVERPYIRDLAGRETRRNYNALVGFQLILR